MWGLKARNGNLNTYNCHIIFITDLKQSIKCIYKLSHNFKPLISFQIVSISKVNQLQFQLL